MAELQQIHKDSNDPPLLAVFPSGIPNSVADETTFPFQHYVSEDKKKAKGSYLFAEDSHLRFIGSTHEDFNLARNNFNYCIGYYQPKQAKKVKLVQAHGVFNMRQVKLDSGEIDDGSKREIDFAAVRKDLTEMFGSRKRKRQLRSEESGRVNIESDEAALQALSTQLNVIETDSSYQADLEKSAAGKLETINKILPPYDIEAKAPVDIYRFTRILPKNLWDTLDAPKMLCLRLSANNNKVPIKMAKKNHSDDMNDSLSSSSEDDSDSDSSSLSDLEQEEKEEKVQNVYTPLTDEEQDRVNQLPQYIRLRREKLLPLILSAHTTNNTAQIDFVKQRVVQLAYLTIIFRIIKSEKNRKMLKSKEEFSKHILSPQSSPHHGLMAHIKQSLFKTSAPSIASAFNNEAKFRVLCHLCVLSLITGDGMELSKSDVAVIANDLQLPASQLVNIYKTVGCNASNDANIKLKAPLKLDIQPNNSSRTR